MPAPRTSEFLAINMSVSVWVDGEDPDQAQRGQVCLVARNCIRVRVPQPLEPRTYVRVRAPQRSRSMKGQVSATFRAPDGRPEVAIYSQEAAAYLGVIFPKEEEAAKQEVAANQAEEFAPPTTEPEGTDSPRAEELAVAEASPDVVLEQMPSAALSASVAQSTGPGPDAPGRLPAEMPARSLEVVVSGIDCARSPFSQPATGTLDASGSLRVHLGQLVDLGSRVRVTLAAKDGAGQDRHWNCRVYSRSAVRTSEGLWVYRLIFEKVQELFRELELPAGERSLGREAGESVLAELQALRTVVVALAYQMRQHGLLEDDALLADFLSRELGPGPI